MKQARSPHLYYGFKPDTLVECEFMAAALINKPEEYTPPLGWHVDGVLEETQTRKKVRREREHTRYTNRALPRRRT